MLGNISCALESLQDCLVFSRALITVQSSKAKISNFSLSFVFHVRRPLLPRILVLLVLTFLCSLYLVCKLCYWLFAPEGSVYICFFVVCRFCEFNEYW